MVEAELWATSRGCHLQMVHSSNMALEAEQTCWQHYQCFSCMKSTPHWKLSRSLVQQTLTTIGSPIGILLVTGIC